MQTNPNPTVLQDITKALQSIETQYGVKILYACESGSRSWGFPSPDSDFDVRFVYAHPRDWYLSISEHKDNIQFFAQDGLLDFSGWDIRKVLKHIQKSNPSLIDWLHSPIIYQQSPDFIPAIQPLCADYFVPKSGAAHYMGLCKGMLAELSDQNRIKIKKLFYILRPLLAARWIVERGTVPPMHLGGLLPVVSEDLQALITAWVDKKYSLDEAFVVEIEPQLADFIRTEFPRIDILAKQLPSEFKDADKLNHYFRNLLLQHS